MKDIERPAKTRIESSSEQLEEMTEIRQLFDEAAHEWSELSASLHDLKRALEPEEFQTALRHLRIPDLKEVQQEWESARAVLAREHPATASVQSAGKMEIRDASDTRDPSSAKPRFTPKAAEPLAEAPVPARQPEEAASAADASLAEEASDSPAHPVSIEHTAAPVTSTDPEIKERLAEMVSLLKQHIANSNDGGQPSGELPKNLTLAIAREVAGRVKESVVETLKTSGQGAPSDSTSRPDEPLRVEEAKRIPIDDVAAMIDQLSGLD